MSRIRSTGGGGQGKYLLASAVVLALLVSPFAVAAGTGDPVRIGVRNPSGPLSQAATSETQIIASTSTYGTRQSNKGAGGGAIYGCRATPGAEPCLRGVNLNTGRAFEFSTRGAEGGFIRADAANARPFATNATGVATGLNSDKVDGLDAADIVTAAQALTKFAIVGANGNVLQPQSRGVTSSTRTGDGRYEVKFAIDVSSCAFTATQTTVVDAGATAVQRHATDNTIVHVVTRAGGGGNGTEPTVPADRPFHLIATC
jgi:hypothetical protein